MKTNRGFLLAEETLKIIVAVICILFLAYLLISLYMKGSENKELASAGGSLGYLINETNRGVAEINIYSPSGWWIISWPNKDNIRPVSCSNSGWENCLCICKKSLFTVSPQGYANDCDKKGVCNFISKKIIVKGSSEQSPIKIVQNLTLKINGDEITQK